MDIVGVFRRRRTTHTDLGTCLLQYRISHLTVYDCTPIHLYIKNVIPHTRPGPFAGAWFGCHLH